jgi:hypothetical protein
MYFAFYTCVMLASLILFILHVHFSIFSHFLSLSSEQPQLLSSPYGQTNIPAYTV